MADTTTAKEASLDITIGTGKASSDDIAGLAGMLGEPIQITD
jgi:hypothetical protein